MLAGTVGQYEPIPIETVEEGVLQGKDLDSDFLDAVGILTPAS